MKINLRPFLSAPLLFFILSFSVLYTPQGARTPPVNLNPIDLSAEPDQPVLVRIYFKDVNDLNLLAATLDIWEINHESDYLLALVRPEHFQSISQSSFRVEIDDEKSTLLQQQYQFLPNQNNGIPGFPCYRTVEETYTDLAQLSADNPSLATWIDIGDSWEKDTPGGKSGYDLFTLVLTNSAIPGPKPKLYIISAMHGRELPTAELATRFAEYLVDNYSSDPDITWLLDYAEVHITPHANPDGRKIAENGDFWRKNTDNDDGCLDASWWGTDLNRNSSFKWGGVGASAFPCDDTYHGPAPSSEPETQSLQNYAASIFPDQRGPGDANPAQENASGLFITLHSYGNLVLFPWGWTSDVPPNDTSLETLGRKFGFFTNYQVCQSGEIGCIYQTSGSTDDWTYGELGVASYTFELGSTFFESCEYFADSILPDNLEALIYAFKAARHPYKDPAGPESIHLALTADHIAPGAGLTLTATADDTRYNSNGKGEEAVQIIAAARYSIDSPSWVDGVTTYPLSAKDGNFNNYVESLTASIDTTALAFGRHTIFVESQDSDSNWGVPTTIFLWITRETYLPGIVPDQQIQFADSLPEINFTVQVTNLGT
ncbi:M14 family zinc carboxypeptidase, partial [Chloroflexota bacterium]